MRPDGILFFSEYLNMEIIKIEGWLSYPEIEFTHHPLLPKKLLHGWYLPFQPVAHKWRYTSTHERVDRTCKQWSTYHRPPHFFSPGDKIALSPTQIRWGVLYTVFASHMSIYTRMAMPPNTRGHHYNISATYSSFMTPHSLYLLSQGWNQRIPSLKQSQRNEGVISYVWAVCGRTTRKSKTHYLDQ